MPSRKLYVTLIWKKGLIGKRVEEGFCHEIEFMAIARSETMSYVEVLWLGELERRAYPVKDLKVVKVSIGETT